MSLSNNIEPTEHTTVATTATLFFRFFKRLFVRPPTPTSATNVAQLNEVVADHVSYPGVGAHDIGHMGRAVRKAGSANVRMLIGSEGVVQNLGAGTVDIAVANAAHMNDNRGDITLCVLNYSLMSNNTGNIGTLVHYYVDAGGGEINQAAVEFFLYNLRARALIATAGQLYGPLGVQTSFGGGEIAPPRHAGMLSGVRYSCNAVSTSPVALTANLMYGTPVFIPHRVTLASLGCTVTTAGAAGKKARIGMWPFTHGTLGSKVAECAEFAVDSTGDKSGAVAGSVVVEAGLYFLGILSDGAPVIEWNVDYAMTGILGTTNAAKNDTILYAAATYGTLPTQPALSRTANAASLFPHLWVQVA